MIGAHFFPDDVRGTFMRLMFQAMVAKLPLGLNLNQPADDSSGANPSSTASHYLLTTTTL